MSADGERTTLAAYLRLLRYVRPYGARLAVGILAGVVAGGSIFPLLQLSRNLVAPFETAAAPAAGAPAAPATGDGGADAVVRVAERLGIRALNDDGRMTWQFLVLTVSMLPVLVVLRSAAYYVNRYAMRWVGARVVRDVRDALFEHLQAQSLKFFGRHDTGQLISRCTNDTNVIDTLLPTTIADVSTAPVEIVSAVAFVVTASLTSGLMGIVALMFVGFPLCIVPIVLLGRRVRMHTRHALEGVSVLVSRMHENFGGIRVVKAFHTERREAGRFREMNAAYFGSIVRALRAELLMTPLMEGVGLVLAIVFFVVCYTRGVRLQDILSLGLAAVVAYRPIKQLARINANLQRGAAAMQRIYELLDRRDELPEAARPVRADALRERIVFEDVSFAYDPGDSPVLRDVRVEIPAGSVVALVGETGSGKTTMANLLARFYDPTEGRVLLDGVDLREIEIASLRRLIGVVTQETILFNDTLANNIAYGTEGATREEIEAAARKANAHDFITADPDGYARMAGDRGFVLSGGEKQRIAIARAILRNPPILILDEATSSLDTVTERLVQEAIAHAMEGRTVFAIAHRLSTVRHADQILLLDGGRIAERGTHDELLAAGGRYRRLCEMQMLQG